MKKSLRTQKGFTLVEVMVAVLISIMLATFKLYPMMAEARSTKATAQAIQLQTLGNSIATYSTKYYGPLVNGTAITGVANPYAPTIAELQSLGLLTSNFSTTNMYSGGYGVQISKLPSGCVAPNCDIQNLVYLTNAITNSLNGRVDEASIGQAAQAVGADGGYSDSATPGTITGPSGAWSVANPVTAAGQPVAGILAMRSGYNSSTLAQFMRRDGQLPATGAQDMGGQNVNNVATLNSTTINNSGNASVGGTLGVTGQTTTNGITNSGTITTGTLNATTATVSGALTAGTATVNGALTAGNTTVNGMATVNGATNVNGTLGVSGGATLASTLTVAGATTTNGLTNNGQLTSTGDIKAPRVYLTTVITAGSSCAGYTGYQATTSTGQIASCVNGIWYANTPQPLSPCNATTVSWQGCTGSLPYTTSGGTANATVSSGTGSATYSCQNGSWAFQSGNCTPPPAGCSAQTIYWNGSAACSGSSSALSSGSGHYVNASNGNSGSAYATCNNGSLTISSASCSVPTATFYNPTANNGAAMSYNPTLGQTFCQGMGYSTFVGGTQQDEGGTSQAVCWTIDGNFNCQGGGNCSGMAYGNPGCYVATSLRCQ